MRYRQLNGISGCLPGCRHRSRVAGLNGEGMPSEAMPIVKLKARREAEWRDDPKVARDIETRLLRSAYDDIAINAEVFVQA